MPDRLPHGISADGFFRLLLALQLVDNPLPLIGGPPRCLMRPNSKIKTSDKAEEQRGQNLPKEKTPPAPPGAPVNTPKQTPYLGNNPRHHRKWRPENRPRPW